MGLGLKGISFVAGLFILAVSVGHAQQYNASQGQRSANILAGALSQDQALSGIDVEIEVAHGVATLSGTVTNVFQKQRCLDVAHQIPGINAVRDALVIRDAQVSPVNYDYAQGIDGGYADGGYVGGGEMGGPAPVGPAGVVGASEGAALGYNLPDYAFPSYGIYPNASTIGYPKAYPWQAWPNIGPFYPYPEVPLGWRAVTLRWDDGIWWLDFQDHNPRPFFYNPFLFKRFSFTR